MHIPKLLSECIRNGIVDPADHTIYRFELVTGWLLVIVENKCDMTQHSVARFRTDNEGIIGCEVQSEICQD